MAYFRKSFGGYAKRAYSGFKSSFKSSPGRIKAMMRAKQVRWGVIGVVLGIVLVFIKSRMGK